MNSEMKDQLPSWPSLLIIFGSVPLKGLDADLKSWVVIRVMDHGICEAGFEP